MRIYMTGLWRLCILQAISMMPFIMNLFRSSVSNSPSEPNVQHRQDDQEFVDHIAKILEQSLSEKCNLSLDLSSGYLIRPLLREHYYRRSVDTMEWILKCAIGEMEFDQANQDELPILCRFYNEYIGVDNWTKNDHTMMGVLNKYDKIKEGGYGRFCIIPIQPPLEAL